MQDYVKIRVLSFDCATTDGEELRMPSMVCVTCVAEELLTQINTSLLMILNTHVVPGGRLRASDTSKLGLREVLWRPNDFPYALEEGIHHDLVWCRTPLSPEELAEVMFVFLPALSTGIAHMLMPSSISLPITHPFMALLPIHLLTRLVQMSFQ